MRGTAVRLPSQSVRCQHKQHHKPAVHSLVSLPHTWGWGEGCGAYPTAAAAACIEGVDIPGAHTPQRGSGRRRSSPCRGHRVDREIAYPITMSDV